MRETQAKNNILSNTFSQREARLALRSKHDSIVNNIPIDTNKIFMAWYDGERQESFLAVSENSTEDRSCFVVHKQENNTITRSRSALFFGGFSFTAERTWSNWPAHFFFSPEMAQQGGDTTNSAITDRATPQFFAQEDIHTWRQRLAMLPPLFQDQTLHKVVAARAVSRKAPSGMRLDHRATFARLMQQNPKGYTFALCLGKQEVFLGASPETLVAVRDRQLTTHALAGTAPRGNTPQEDAEFRQLLLQDTHIAREHQYVVQEIINKLADHCSHFSIDPQIRALPRMQHRETRISAQLHAPLHILELVKKLHPTPALGGSPTGQALAWLAAHEPLVRGWYGAPIGWYNEAGEGVFAVAIRSMLLRTHEAILFAGAGLVEGFSADHEWNETSLKLATAQDALAFQAEAP